MLVLSTIFPLNRNVVILYPKSIELILCITLCKLRQFIFNQANLITNARILFLASIVNVLNNLLLIYPQDLLCPGYFA